MNNPHQLNLHTVWLLRVVVTLQKRLLDGTTDVQELQHALDEYSSCTQQKLLDTASHLAELHHLLKTAYQQQQQQQHQNDCRQHVDGASSLDIGKPCGFATASMQVCTGSIRRFAVHAGW